MHGVTTFSSPAQAAAWLHARQPSGLCADSRKLVAGQAFVAWPGYGRDARGFVKAALATGAVGCLVEAEGLEPFGFNDGARIAALPGLKAAAGAVADAYYGEPSRRLSLVAVTGTNGKTSTACWVAQALQSLKRRCAVIGTLGIGEPPDFSATGLTTPDPLTLHAALADFAKQGVTACAIEATSIGLVEHRLNGAHIDVALFTNFTRDHLDYHGDMASYWAAKRSLFDWPGLRAAVINVDDAQGAALAAELETSALPDSWTVALHGPARLRAEGLRYGARGLAFEVCEGAATASVDSTLVGDFNASNLLVVIAALRALGVPLADAAAAAGSVTTVAGRLQRVQGAGIDVIVDYAHTPDALEKVLGALRPMAAARRGRLVCVFGCGGDRDASKRPLMGAIAERLADAVIVTSDNPRSEEPASIIDQVLAGMTRTTRAHAIVERGEAIEVAVRHAKSGDVLLLAGKGHEDYQETAGVRRHFSDIEEAQRALAAKAAA